MIDLAEGKGFETDAGNAPRVSYCIGSEHDERFNIHAWH
jgi:hypothetical protein